MLPVPQRRLCRERRHPRRGGAAHAPVIFQEAGDPIRDLYAAFDFDGDWNGDNNAENMECWSDASKCNTPDHPFSTCAGQRCPLIATVYRTVIETPTHWFIQYLPYHPRDWKLTNGHEHDTESLLMVVARAGGGFGRLQILETRFHLDWFRYAADPAVAAGQGSIDGPVHTDAASGRPAVDSQLAGHGLCGGFAPPNFLFPDLQLTCDHAGQPHLVRTGVIYSPDTVPIEMPMVVDGRAVPAGYRLVELLTSIWPHRFEIGRGKAFLSAMDYQGERCDRFQCPKQFGGRWEGNEGSPPAEPWGQPGGPGVTAVGDQFFDPAYTLSQRLSFPQPYSLDDCFNPYLGIDDTCDSAADGGVPDAGEDGGDAGAGPVDAGQGGADAGEGDAGAGAIAAPRGCGSGPGPASWLAALAGALLPRRRARIRNCTVAKVQWVR